MSINVNIVTTGYRAAKVVVVVFFWRGGGEGEDYDRNITKGMFFQKNRYPFCLLFGTY